MTKILIANRGEIACRIIRAAKELGLSTVAVHSEADAGSLHVALADEAVAIGPSAPRESYLVAERILEACKTTGADAVHPGYGFLAENADFARAVEAAGLIFVGPSPDAIERMGDKARARETAVAAGVPVLPGSPRFATGVVEGTEEAAGKVGFPLLVKASAGGGGIGMRRVDRMDDLAAAVATTQELAARAFGDGTVYLERFVPRARHIEVQVFGLGDGHAVHLFERDCSLQRRFQKVVEESPAVRLPAAIRARMCDAAAELARSVSYRGAGTVEFVVDTQTDEFFFLEMNTRIQVEHPVTEMVTGTDLVGLQLKLALGQLEAGDLPEIRSDGHAIECRIYAEDPARNFLPSPGLLKCFRMPAASEHVRIDTGVREGDSITPFYDPMIAKLICRGSDRASAIEAALRALEDVRIDGVRTNVEFLKAALAHPGFVAGDIHTGFLAEHGAVLNAAVAETKARISA